jgi:TnpA family transposase
LASSLQYFGKDQGVAAYTFRDERDLLWYSTVFSSAERESAYVIDGLMHNEVVKSEFIRPMPSASATWSSP